MFAQYIGIKFGIEKKFNTINKLMDEKKKRMKP